MMPPVFTVNARERHRHGVIAKGQLHAAVAIAAPPALFMNPASVQGCASRTNPRRAHAIIIAKLLPPK
jgi:hypothetical protein